MEMISLKQAVLETVDELRDSVVAVSRDLYENPELSLEEVRSSRLLGEILAGEKFEVTAAVAGLPTAFVALRRTGRSGPRIAFLAEYDALPGIGHACGHNLIASAALGAGLALGRHAEKLGGEILVIGTPAEETIGGKCIMVRKGVFEGIDAALMIHPASEWRVEADSLACVSIKVIYTGREAHAVAWPEKGINALDPMIQLFIAVEMMKKRLGRDVRIPGVILEGGVRANIVPARTVGHFTIRALDSAARDRARAEFERVAREIGSVAGCGVSFEPTDEPYDELVTNKTMAAVFAGHLEEWGITVLNGPRPNKGSLDMGNVSRVVPSLHPFISICDRIIPSHSEEFARATISKLGEDALMIAVRALALTGLDLLTRADLLEAVKKEFSASGPR